MLKKRYSYTIFFCVIAFLFILLVMSLFLTESAFHKQRKILVKGMTDTEVIASTSRHYEIGYVLMNSTKGDENAATQQVITYRFPNVFDFVFSIIQFREEEYVGRAIRVVFDHHGCLDHIETSGYFSSFWYVDP